MYSLCVYHNTPHSTLWKHLSIMIEFERLDEHTFPANEYDWRRSSKIIVLITSWDKRQVNIFAGKQLKFYATCISVSLHFGHFYQLETFSFWLNVRKWIANRVAYRIGNTTNINVDLDGTDITLITPVWKLRKISFALSN